MLLEGWERKPGLGKEAHVSKTGGWTVKGAKQLGTPRALYCNLKGCGRPLWRLEKANVMSGVLGPPPLALPESEASDGTKSLPDAQTQQSAFSQARAPSGAGSMAQQQGVCSACMRL